MLHLPQQDLAFTEQIVLLQKDRTVPALREACFRDVVNGEQRARPVTVGVYDLLNVEQHAA
jgi:hypothetical protein